MQWHPVLRRIVSLFEPASSRLPRAARAEATAIAKLGMTAVVLGSIGGGALIGAGLMALVAPFDGKEMRRKIASLLSPELEAPRAEARPTAPPRMRRIADLVVEDEPGFSNIDRRAHPR